ncbi:MAG: adenosylcobinamide-GDP ribazoletransferase [Cellvibrionaceae bacterium]
MNHFYRALVTAFLFLTRIPMPHLENLDDQDSGRAFALFPLVGLVLGVILTTSALFLQGHLPHDVIAGLMVLLWILLTGGLHLDGLGDSADGWLAGGNLERTLEIMKDPRSGSAAVIMISASLLIKFSALSHLIAEQQWWALVLAPMVARALSLSLFLTTPYISPKGIASQFLQHSNRLHLRISVAATILIALIMLEFQTAFWAVGLSLLLFLGLRQLMIRRLGGATGDTSGALIEIVELAFLIGCLVFTG